MKKYASAIVILVTVACIACDRPPDPQVVADFRSGSITWPEIEAVIVGMPEEFRNPPTGDWKSWYISIATNLAFQKILVPQTDLDPLAGNKEHRQIRRVIERRTYSQFYVRQFDGRSLEPTDQQVRQEYALHKERFRRPAQRHISHIFSRYQPGMDRLSISKELTALRGRVLAGENFGLLAAEHSESESRHKSGSIGYRLEAELPDQLAQIVFSLQEAVPSQPVFTKEGGHLFLVSSIVDAREYSYDEVENVIRKQLRAAAFNQAVKGMLATMEISPDSMVPDRDELVALLASKDPTEVILRLGQFEYSIADFQSEVERQFGRDRLVPYDLAFEQIKNEELIYQEMLKQDLADDQQLQLEVQNNLRAALIQEAIRIRAPEIFRAERRGDLEDFYRLNEFRFAPPLRVHLRRLKLEIDESASERMADLEMSKAKIDGAETTFEQAAAELAVAVEDLGWMDASTLQIVDSKASMQAFGLAAGQCSFPYRTDEYLAMIQVVERDQPQPPGFEEAFNDVLDAYISDHSAQVFDLIRQDTLQREDFQLHHEAIEQRIVEQTADQNP